MINKMLVGGTILMLAAKSALGAENMNTGQGPHYDLDNLYRASELSLDVFGTASVGKYTLDHWSGERVRHNTRLGAGLGFNYFITHNLGIGADVYSENTTGPFADDEIHFRPVGEKGVGAEKIRAHRFENRFGGEAVAVGAQPLNVTNPHDGLGEVMGVGVNLNVMKLERADLRELRRESAVSGRQETPHRRRQGCKQRTWRRICRKTLRGLPRPCVVGI